MFSALQLSHQLLSQLIKRFPDGNFIDCTLGNGNDSLFILSHPQFSGYLYGFDIQKNAIENSYALLQRNQHKNHRNYQFFHDSHDKIDFYLADVNSFHGAIYNLGYLPGGDHQITTLSTSTLASIQQILEKLYPKGQIIVVAYTGHDEGKEEKAQLMDSLKQLNQREFNVAHYEFINQKNNPPSLIIIEKR